MTDEKEDQEISTDESAQQGFKRKGGGLMGSRRKGKKKDEDTKGSSVDAKRAGAILRMQKDITGLDLPENVKAVFPIKGDFMNFSLILDVVEPESFWYGGLYEFKFSIPSDYPIGGPTVICVDKIYHPNIDLEGKICVSVLRPWKATYTIQIVMFGLLFLFSHPNPNDPLNPEAAEQMRKDESNFKQLVRQSMRGSYVGGTHFPKNKGKGV